MTKQFRVYDNVLVRNILFTFSCSPIKKGYFDIKGGEMSRLYPLDVLWIIRIVLKKDQLKCYYLKSFPKRIVMVTKSRKLLKKYLMVASSYGNLPCIPYSTDCKNEISFLLTSGMGMGEWNVCIITSKKKGAKN